MGYGSCQADVLDRVEALLGEALSLIGAARRSTGTDLSDRAEDRQAGGQVRYVMAVNGDAEEVDEAKVRSVDPLQYALFLDVTSGRVGCGRSRQGIRSLEETKIAGVQDILAVMIQNPLHFFGHRNVGEYLPHRADMTPNAFRKAMARLRYALQGGSQEGPLLLHFNRCDFSVSETGHAWRISKEAGDICVVTFLPQAEHGPREADQGPNAWH